MVPVRIPVHQETQPFQEWLRFFVWNGTHHHKATNRLSSRLS
jgi:hypothetical protein